MTLDLRSEDAVALLKRLVALSDVVLENFTPRVMRRFGLDYPSLKALKPDLIMVSNTGYGHSGPWSNYGAMAAALEPTHGTGAFMGYMEAEPEGRLLDGGIPNKVANSYTDFLASITAQFAVLAALIHRKTTGRGVCGWIWLCTRSAFRSLVRGCWISPSTDAALGAWVTATNTCRPTAATPARERTSGVTIAVRDDEDWSSFCQAIEQPSLADDPRFVDPFVRYGNQESLDAIITDWTSQRTPYQVMETLQAKGVPAGAVLNAGELLRDPHFRARGFFRDCRASAGNRIGAARVSGAWVEILRYGSQHQRTGPDVGRGQRLRTPPSPGADQRGNPAPAVKPA